MSSRHALVGLVIIERGLDATMTKIAVPIPSPLLALPALDLSPPSANKPIDVICQER
jgi:hypothetical protein